MATSRKEAQAAGLKHYFTGKACKHGHVAERRADSGCCTACQRERRTTRREKENERRRARHVANPEKERMRCRTWLAEHRKSRNERKRAYRIQHREELNELNSVWCTANRGRRNATDAKRHAAKLQATPPWSNLKMIEAVYEAAARKGLEVDHVIPLQGRLVCGLHVPFNLQLLTRAENAAKGNRYAV